MIKKRIKILFSIALSLIVSQIVANEIFFSKSIAIRPNLLPYLAYRLTHPGQVIKDYASTFTNDYKMSPEEVAKLNSLSQKLAPIANGVQAASQDNISITSYTVKDVEWIETTYRLKDGRILKVKSPKGGPIPPKELFDQ